MVESTEKQQPEETLEAADAKASRNPGAASSKGSSSTADPSAARKRRKAIIESQRKESDEAAQKETESEASKAGKGKSSGAGTGDDDEGDSENEGQTTTNGKKRKVKRTQIRYDPDVPMSKEQLAAWRREARRVRNRESAAASRQRIRNRITELETEVDEYKSKYHAAIDRLKELEELSKTKAQQENGGTEAANGKKEALATSAGK